MANCQKKLTRTRALDKDVNVQVTTVDKYVIMQVTTSKYASSRITEFATGRKPREVGGSEMKTHDNGTRRCAYTSA